MLGGSPRYYRPRRSAHAKSQAAQRQCRNGAAQRVAFRRGIAWIWFAAGAMLFAAAFISRD